LAVINELTKHDPKLKAYFVTDKNFGAQAAQIMSKASVPVKTKQIFAGKFRRYHKMSILRQILDIQTVLLNLRDLFYTAIGFVQSLILLVRVKPDVVFTKGGFVCMPVGLAANLLHIPVVVHDSDAHPGFTNRVIAKHAASIATGSPVENYNYPKGRTHYVGIPVSSSFRPVSDAQKQKLKAALGLHNTKKPLVVVTGGGLGARNINRSMTTIALQLLPSAAVVHITGDLGYKEVVLQAPEDIDYIIKPFISTGMAPVFGAADVVVTRAGATTMQELAAMTKPVIIIPNPLLTGGHQLKNAAVYQKDKAAIVIDEDKLVVNPLMLLKAIRMLIDNPDKAKILGQRLHSFAKPDAAVDTAALIAEAAAIHKHQEVAK
jgi:UDP-N-acetylglucosamine--N-acetylmuramyl-(pentapeptide) pyrophosphoryl-undecaprenol N-acetylglucosamine transferase